MLLSYLKIAYRQLLKRALFSFVNVVGLAVAMAAVFLIWQYVVFEMNYDRFHEKSDRIYRVAHSRYQDGVLQYQKAQTFIPVGEALKRDYAFVEEYATLFKISDQSEIVVTYYQDAEETIKFNEKRVYHVKGDFFKVFTVAVMEGKMPAGPLQPKTVWISSSVAKKYFGNYSPLNKIIHHSYSGDFKIVGVYDDFPENSHLKPDFLFSWESVSDQASGGDANNWHWDGFFTYILLTPGTPAGHVEGNWPTFTAKYLGRKTNRIGESKFFLQPLTDIHLHSHLQGEADTNGNALVIGILKVLSLFILLIAYINYINLSTAKAIERVKEIGVRRIVGSTRGEVAAQFMIESLVITSAAVIPAAFLVFLLTNNPYIEGLNLSPTLLVEGSSWIVVAMTIAFGSLASAFYPAFIISSRNVANVLRGKRIMSDNRFPVTLRTSMVTFQFVLAIFMITGSLMIHKQIRFMKTRELGLDISQTLVLETFVKFGPPGSYSVFTKSLQVLKNKLISNPKIAGVTASYDIPGKEHLSLFPNFRNIKNSEELVSLYYSRIDYDFIPLFNVKVLAGRNFSNDMTTDESAIVINREALDLLGFEKADDAINYEVTFGREPNLRKANIIGVVDFRAASFKEKNLPVVYQINWAPLRYLSIKLNDVTSLSDQIAFVKKQWESHFPDQPFNYFFLDEYFNQQYQADQKFSLTLTLFTVLSIVIACMGLYGLSSIVTSQRTKEIGIRKVLGASIKNLFLMLSKDFGVMIFIAGAISAPIVWYAISKWLDNYAYHTQMSWWIFVLPLIAMLFIVFLTIGHHALRTALANPVDTLKDE